VRFNELSVIETEKSGLEALYREKLAASKKNSESLMEERNRLTMQVMAFEHELTGRASRRENLIERKRQAMRELTAAKEEFATVENKLNEIQLHSAEALEKRDKLSERAFSLLATYRERAGEKQALDSRRDHVRSDLHLLDDDLATMAESLDRLHLEADTQNEVISRTEVERLPRRKVCNGDTRRRMQLTHRLARRFPRFRDCDTNQRHLSVLKHPSRVINDRFSF